MRHVDAQTSLYEGKTSWTYGHAIYNHLYVFNFVESENLTEIDDEIFKSILCSDKDRKRVSYLLNMGMKKRLDMYQKASKNDNNFQNLYPIYKKSFEALQITPNIYFGDITYCSVKEREGAYENFNAVLEKWDDILLGNIKQKTIAGNHYTCMNVEHAVSLARVIISETGDDNLDDIKSEKEEVHFIVTEDCLEKNHFYMSNILGSRNSESREHILHIKTATEMMLDNW